MISQSDTRREGEKPATLLLVNPMGRGHGAAYASSFTRWAISRGFRVVHAGADLRATAFGRACAAGGRVEFVADGGIDCSLEGVRALRERTGAALTVHLGADEWLFTCDDMFAPGAAPLANTIAVATFAGREAHTGQREPYGLRLDAVLERGLVSGVFTLDEYHAHAQIRRGVRFLPDPCRELMGSGEPSGHEAARLRAFLDAAPGPVLPVLGKRDARKNSLWIFKAVADSGHMRCVVLGEAVRSETAGEEDELLAWLAARGRALVHEGYLPGDRLFLSVLAHRAVPFAALPYRRHYGSSGIQLLAHRCGKPALVAGQGLMARRVEGNALGLAHHPGDEAHFREQLGRMFQRDAGADRAAARAFSRYFRTRAVFAAMDAMLPGRPLPQLPPWASGPLQPGPSLDELGRSPHTATEFNFLCGLRFDLAGVLQRLGRPDEARAEMDAVLAMASAGEGGIPVGLDASALESLGSALAAMARPDEAERAFARAVGLAPRNLDLRLFLSDSLRYAGRSGEALAALAELEALAPAHPGLRHKQGQALACLGRTDEALARFAQEPEGSRWKRPAQEWEAKLRRGDQAR
ncbi:tetratricopeptide repeat protein [Fundidesulfovibrio soli]|uniref:tetratricopeptide repeat protein n=1 Tax=Fundidesulfovibrio soli TaxID=2922716 RepID=UPI001FAF7F0A|nr:tetratricopeptide repeat protein [Fundidesulfovibrio soli]